MAVGHVIRWNEKTEFFQLGLKEVYDDEMKVLENQYKTWLKEKTVTEFFTKVLGHSGLGTMPEKTIGGAPARDRIYYGVSKTYTLKTYGLTLVVQHEVIKWDLYGVYKPVTQELAKTAVQRKDLEAYKIWNLAFSTSDPVYTDYRGDALCATSHERMDGGTWSNRAATDVGLSQLSIQDGITSFRKTPNERGKFLVDLMPKWLMTTVENDWLANTLVNSQYNPDNANQQVNNVKRYSLDVHTSPLINAASTYWFLVAPKDKLQIAMGLGEAPDLRSDTEPGTRNLLFNSYTSFRIETYSGKGIYGSTGV